MGKARQIWRENKGFMLFLGLMFVFRSAVADWNDVPSSSMNPTLLAGDRVVVNKLAYSLRVPFTLREIVRWRSPKAGDVVTFDSPVDGVNLIKRVVAVGGDVVAMRNNQLIINGHAVPRTLVEPQREIPTEAGRLLAEVWREELGGQTIEVARLPAVNSLRDFEPVTVPQGQLLVLGDSRDNSKDSRYIGFVDVHRVTGKAERVAFSLDSGRYFLPRDGRWWRPLHV